MKYRLLTIEQNGLIYVNGFTADPDGIELDPQLANELAWVDQWGNWKWQLLNGKIQAAGILASADQVAAKAETDQIDKITKAWFKLLRQVFTTTTTPTQSWVAIDAAVRKALQNGGL
jgi:hypothetical protein